MAEEMKNLPAEPQKINVEPHSAGAEPRLHRSAKIQSPFQSPGELPELRGSKHKITFDPNLGQLPSGQKPGEDNTPGTKSMGIKIGEGGEEGVEIKMHKASVDVGEAKEGQMHLKYGDKIRIKITHQDERNQAFFYLSSDGFPTRRLYFRQEKGLPSTNDEFLIVPRGYYGGTKQLRWKLKKLRRKLDEKSEKDLRELAEEDAGYQIEIPKEVEANRSTYADKRGAEILYNSEVQLIHAKTQLYVSISKKLNLSEKPKMREGEKSTMSNSKELMRVYSLKLVPFSSEGTHFIIWPCFNYQSGQRVLKSDFFYLAYRDAQLLKQHFFLYFDMKPQAKSVIEKKQGVIYFNTYLYEEANSRLQFEHELPVKKHKMRDLYGKAVWITHIQANSYLALERFHNVSEQKETAISSMISNEGDTSSQTFVLLFKKYDDPTKIPTDGLWMMKMDNLENHANIIDLKHIHFNVWIRDITVKHMLRTDSDLGNITSGSMIKIRHSAIKDWINVDDERNERSQPTERKILLSPSAMNLDNFTQGIRPAKVNEELDGTVFKIIAADPLEQQIVNTLAHLSSFIKRFDIQLMTKYYDFTEDAGYTILGSALKQLKLLALNALPGAIQTSLPYKKPNEFVQRLMRESNCINYLALLLQKLFPSGHSVDPGESKAAGAVYYSENPHKRKLLCPLLILLAIAVKNNKESQIYTFRNAMRIIQKYIGVKMKHDKQKDIALLSVVENCEEILIDPSLENIINQFLSELCSYDMAERMKKYDILSILRIFCLFASKGNSMSRYADKGIASTQDLLYRTLFESAKGEQMIFLEFKIDEETFDLKVAYGTYELNLSKADEEAASKLPSHEAHNIGEYFSAQLYLMGDICKDNKNVLEPLKAKLPVEAILANLHNKEVSPVIKAGLARVFLAFFSNTEDVAQANKPRLQRSRDETFISLQRKSKYMTEHQLNRLKGILQEAFENSMCTDDKDLKLLNEYMRILTYLLKNDFLFGAMDEGCDWRGKQKDAYNLMRCAFGLICAYFHNTNEINRKQKGNQAGMRRRTTTPNLSQVHDETEEEQVVIVRKEGKVEKGQLASLEFYLRYPMNYAAIFHALATEKRQDYLSHNYQKDTSVTFQEEIFTFFNEIMYFVQDTYLTNFTCMINRVFDNDPELLETMAVRFMKQLFNKGVVVDPKKHTPEPMVPEVTDALLFENVSDLYVPDHDQKAEDLRQLLITEMTDTLANSKNLKLESLLLELLLGSELPKLSFYKYVGKLYLISDLHMKRKQAVLYSLIPKMDNIINQANCLLNVGEIRNIKGCHKLMEDLMEHLKVFYKLFSRNSNDLKSVEDSKNEGKESEYDFIKGNNEKGIVFEPIPSDCQDSKFKQIFLKQKAYSIIIEFMRVSSRVKIVSATNIMGGSAKMGLHEYDFSNKILEITNVCNRILITLCQNNPKAKAVLLKHIGVITLIPPPEANNPKAWKEHSERSASDIELINEIIQGNTEVSNLNNQEITRYLTDLVTRLNTVITEDNIEKIFFLFENLMELTTHEGLYKMILGFFWKNKSKIDYKHILRHLVGSESIPLVAKLNKLIRSILLMGSSDDLKRARAKLRDLFPIDLIKIAFFNIRTMFPHDDNDDGLSLMTTLAKIYNMLYLQDKRLSLENCRYLKDFLQEECKILREVQNTLQEQRNLLQEERNNPERKRSILPEERNNPEGKRILVGEHIYLISELYTMLSHLTTVLSAETQRRKAKSKDNDFGEDIAENLRLDMQLIDSIFIYICGMESSNDPRVVAITEVFGHRADFMNQLQYKEGERVKTLFFAATIKKSKTMMLPDRFEKVSRLMEQDIELKKALKIEMEEFCNMLYSMAFSAAEEDLNNVSSKEGQPAKIFISKLIQFIGRACDESLNPLLIKTLLKCFIKVLKMVESENQKKVLLTLQKLALTSTIVHLMCSDESSILDVIFPILLKLANRLLTGSMREVQDQFYNCFQKDNASTLFERIYNALNRNIFIYYKHPQLFGLARNESRQAKKQMIVQDGILKFLQLLCENHHEKLQGFVTVGKDFAGLLQSLSSDIPSGDTDRNLRHNKATCEVFGNINQINQEAHRRVKRSNKAKRCRNGKEHYENEVIAAAFLFENEAIKIAPTSRLFYKNSMSIMKALCEMVQGPCEKNQNAIAETNFFSIAKEILNLAGVKNKAGRGDEIQEKEILSDFEIARLKTNCALLLLSIMEQQDKESTIIAKMKQTIEDNDLLQNICLVYDAFMFESGGDYTEERLFEHMESKEQSISSSYVLELGFVLIFILKAWYYEVEIPPGKKPLEKLNSTENKIVQTEFKDSGLIQQFRQFFSDLIFGFVNFGKKAFKKIVSQVIKMERKAKVQTLEFQTAAVDFFVSRTGTIEIVRNDKAEIVNFPLLPYAKAFSEERKMQIYDILPIDKPKKKLNTILEKADEWLRDCQTEYLFETTFRQYPVFGAVTRHLPLWKTLAYYLAVALNVINLCSFRKTYADDPDHIDHPQFCLFDGCISESATSTFITVFGILLALFSGISVMAFLFQYILTNYYAIKGKLDKTQTNRGSAAAMLQQQAKFWALLIKAIASNLWFYYQIGYLCFAIIGLAIHPFFFTFHLLTIIFRYQRLTNVLQALRHKWTEILLTLLLFFIFEYLFSIVGYAAFAPDYKDSTCSSLFSCFLINVDQTFKQNGGIGAFNSHTYTVLSEEQDGEYSYGILFFDWFFNFFLLILIVQILGGIIIDEFSKIREETEAKEKDLLGSCIICGKEITDKVKGGIKMDFQTHIKSVHPCWDYLMFIGYLNRKPKSEFSGIESYSYESYCKKEINWLPYSLNQNQAEEDDIGALKEKLDKLRSTLKEKKTEDKGKIPNADEEEKDDDDKKKKVRAKESCGDILVKEEELRGARTTTAKM